MLKLHTLKAMTNRLLNNYQAGFTPIVVVILLVVGAIAVGGANVPIVSHPNSPAVQGVLIARGDDSGGSSGSSTSGSSESGSSSSGSSSSTTESHSGSGSSGSQSGSGSSSGSTSKSENAGSSEPSNAPGMNMVPVKPIEARRPEIPHIPPRPLPTKEVEKKHELDVTKEAESEIKHGMPVGGKQHDMEMENELENELEHATTSARVAVATISNQNGELEIETKDATGASHKQRRSGRGPGSPLKVKLVTKQGEQELEVEADNELTKLKVGSDIAETKFPISVNKETGQVFVQTGNGQKEIKILPDKASETAEAAGIISKIDSIELEHATENQNEVAFKVAGVKTGRLLGFIPVQAHVETEVDASTGSVLRVQQPLWLRLLNPVIR